jgi:hypothetical protein
VKERKTLLVWEQQEEIVGRITTEPKQINAIFSHNIYLIIIVGSNPVHKRKTREWYEKKNVCEHKHLLVLIGSVRF